MVSGSFRAKLWTAYLNELYEVRLDALIIREIRLSSGIIEYYGCDSQFIPITTTDNIVIWLLLSKQRKMKSKPIKVLYF